MCAIDKAPGLDGFTMGFFISGGAQAGHHGEVEQLRILRIILVLFEDVTGLDINWQKSHIFPINEVTNMEALAMILGREVGALPTSYLGMSLGAKSKYLGIWSNVPEKCERKRSRGKFRYLSLGGRVLGPAMMNQSSLHDSTTW
ncbi:hypothetical protein H5410_020700 [Solanum commersonii]|uniref:Uncharacterized protein n=1 Tax=Solanum commersonii TaxID=4109 RepID=A0A9J5Z8T1_SOLCO|nr:hypothetical protein H5410_020700 [Solanum commersonii]